MTSGFMHLDEQPVCSPWLRHDALRMYNLLVCSPAVWHVMAQCH